MQRWCKLRIEPSGHSFVVYHFSTDERPLHRLEN
jgi:hypothetical protein